MKYFPRNLSLIFHVVVSSGENPWETIYMQFKAHFLRKIILNIITLSFAEVAQVLEVHQTSSDNTTLNMLINYTS